MATWNVTVSGTARSNNSDVPGGYEIRLGGQWGTTVAYAGNYDWGTVFSFYSTQTYQVTSDHNPEQDGLWINGGAEILTSNISATEVNPTYSITVIAPANGTLSVNKTTAKAGDTITLSTVANTGYQLAGYTTSPVQTITNNSFTMPAANVTVSCTFSKISYTINRYSNPSGAGTVVTTKNGSAAASANYGDTIAVSQTPASGYVFQSYTTSPASLISNGQFTMPAQNVSITANYRKLSTGTLSNKNPLGGGSVILTISTESTAYTHKYKLSFGTNMETAMTNVAANVKSVTIDIPLSWSNYIPNHSSTSGVSGRAGTLTLETWNGNTKLGETTITGITYNVPPSVKPTIGTILTSIAAKVGANYDQIGAYYIQNHCGVRIQTTASGAYSSTITSITVGVNGYTGNKYNKTQSYSAAPYSIDFTSGLLGYAGTATITVTATDSRGRTGSKTATIQVQPYNNPTGNLKLWRTNQAGYTDDYGEYGKYELSASFSQIGNNALTKTLSYSGGSATNPGNTGTLMPEDQKFFDIQQEYGFTLTLTDYLETTVITASLNSARFILAFDQSGNHIGVMKFPNKSVPAGKLRTFEISDDTQVYIGNDTLEDYIRSIINSMNQ